MNKYERHAYLYSAWAALFVPIVTISYYLFSYLQGLIPDFLSWGKIIGLFLPIAVVYGALGFLVRELFRQTSKQLFQFKLFKEDETKMPTTQYLLFNNKIASMKRIQQISDKVKKDFNVELPTIQEQRIDEKESRLRIVEIVGMIRKVTHSKLLEQTNYRYGFRRNCLGGLVWSMAIEIILCIVIAVNSMPITVAVIGIAVILLQFGIIWWSLKPAARNYARELFNTFLTQNP